jgi:tetratricopeptide (TPR) repeat protein
MDVMSTVQDLSTQGELSLHHVDFLELSEAFELSPTDDNRRRLAQYLFDAGDVRASLSLLEELKIKLSPDRLMIARAHLSLEQWDWAEAILTELVQDWPSGIAYYYLARTVARGRRLTQGQHPSEFDLAVSHLKAALTSDHALPEAYIWLDQLLSYHGGYTEAETVLCQGVEKHPDYPQLRVAWANTAIHSQKSAQEVLDILSPLLQSEDCPSQALWLAHSQELRLGRLVKAAGYVGQLANRAGQSDQASYFRLMRAKLLLHSGRIDESIAEFRHDVKCTNLEIRCAVNLHLAYVMTTQEKVQAAFAYINNAVESWLEYSQGAVPFIGLSDITFDGFETDGFAAAFPQIQDFDLSEWSLSHAETEAEHHLARLIKYWESDATFDDEGRRSVAAQLSPRQMPVVNDDMSIMFIRKNRPDRALEYYMAYAEARVDKFDHQLGYRWDFFHDGKVDSEKCFEDADVKARFLATAMKFAKRHKADPQFITKFVTPLYNYMWRKMLIEEKLWDDGHAIAAILQTTVSDPNSSSFLFDIGLFALEQNHLDEAENAYRKVIAAFPKYSDAYHNLSIAVQSRSIDEAIQFQTQAVACNPEGELFSTRLDNLKARKQAAERERQANERARQEREDFLKSARERFPSLDRNKRKILSVFQLASKNITTISRLAEYSGIEERWLKSHLEKLQREGFLVPDGSDRLKVNDYILDLVVRERSHAVVTQIIRADSTITCKPIFNSQREHLFYNVLIGLFPNHLVFPNMSLQSIFQYQRMKELLTEPGDFDYFLRSQVDFCITSTANYLPLIAFEVDSDFHDGEQQKVRDQRKNRIFALGGVSLLRFRPFGDPSEQGVRNYVIEAVRDFYLAANQDGSNSSLKRITVELDIERIIG